MESGARGRLGDRVLRHAVEGSRTGLGSVTNHSPSTAGPAARAHHHPGRTATRTTVPVRAHSYLYVTIIVIGTSLRRERDVITVRMEIIANIKTE